MKKIALYLRKKNSLIWFLSLLTLWFVVLGGQEAYAQVTVGGVQVINARGEVCAQYPGLITRVVYCVQDVVRGATTQYLARGFGYMVSTVQITAAFAVLLYAITILTGQTRSVTREGIILVLKITFAIFVMNQLNTLFPFLLDSMQYLVAVVAAYIGRALPNLCGVGPNLWLNLDCILSHVVGVGLPGATVGIGMIGFLVASLFSGPIGVAIFFMGVGLILIMVFTFLQALFIFLGSYIVLALLMVISPLMIPLIMLKQTKAYFEKWLRLVFTVILQPMFLFAYLSMFLLAVNTVVFTGTHSVYRTVMCGVTVNNQNTFGAYINSGGIIAERSGKNSMFDYTVNQTPRTLGCAAPDRVDSGVPGNVLSCAQGQQNQRDDTFGNEIYTQGNINVDLPSLAINYEALAMRAQACVGPINDTSGVAVYMLRVVLSLLTALAVVYVMHTLISIIPMLGATMAGEMFGVSNLSNIASSLIPKDSLLGAIKQSQNAVEKGLGIK